MALRPDRMTEKERMQALFNHEKPDRIPIWPFAMGFAVRHSDHKGGSLYKDHKALNAVRQLMRKYNWMSTTLIGYSNLGSKEFGGEIKWPTSEFSQTVTTARYPVQTKDDTWNLTLPDVRTAGMIPKNIAACQFVMASPADNEPFCLPVLVGPFSAAGNICGVENLCRWLVKEPETVHRLMRMATDFLVELARHIRDACGTLVVIPWMGEATSANQIISEKHFAEFVFPYQKEFHEKLLDLGYQHIFSHICGDQNLNLPYWAQIPMGNPGMISIGHEVDIKVAASYFPNDIIVGNIEPVIIQEGSPAQVYELSRICIEKGKKCPGGFILGPGCEMPPQAPTENVWMMTQAVNDFGWYE